MHSFSLSTATDGLAMDWADPAGRRNVSLRVLAEVLDEFHSVRGAQRNGTRSYALHERFAEEVLAGFGRDEFDVRYDEVADWIRQH
jgi:hypothetical protein